MLVVCYLLFGCRGALALHKAHTCEGEVGGHAIQLSDTFRVRPPVSLLCRSTLVKEENAHYKTNQIDDASLAPALVHGEKKKIVRSQLKQEAFEVEELVSEEFFHVV